jgi:predicted N-acetyltransferase YhbS
MITIRPFELQDAPAVSAVIRTTMRVSNAHDYAPARLQPLIDYFSPEKVAQLSRERHCLVACVDGQVVGTAALEGAEIATFFVLPDHQGGGIGRRLIQALEQHARAQGLVCLTVDSSLTGAAFYARMGYRRTGVEREGTAGPQIGMHKDLGEAG